VQQRDRELSTALRRVAIAGAEAALYCDRSEHVEVADVTWLQNCSEALLTAAVDMAEALGLDLLFSYAQRLGEIEIRSPYRATSDYDGGSATRVARTWRDLQEIQARHDREYHPDVIGLSRIDQARHCTLHVSKLTGWYARAAGSEEALREIVDRRLADTLLFGLKVASLARVMLADEAIPRSGSSVEALSPQQRLSRSSGV
jgi:hypothetical protein